MVIMMMVLVVVLVVMIIMIMIMMMMMMMIFLITRNDAEGDLQWDKHQNYLPNDLEGNGAEDLKFTDAGLLSDKNVVRTCDV